MSKKQIFTRWFFVCFLCIAGIYSCLGLKLNDNALDLLPRQAVEGNIQLLQKMGLVDRVFITLSVDEALIKEGTDPKSVLKNSIERLGRYMQDSGMFSFVLAKLPQGYEYALFESLRKSLPYILDEQDYDRLNYLVSREGIQENLRNSFVLLNSPAGMAMKKQVQLDPLALVPLAMKKLGHLRSEFSMQLDEGVFFSSDSKHCLLLAESKVSLTDSAQALEILKLLEKGYSEALGEGVTARIIGSLPHTLANSSIIKRDLRLLLPLASILLCILLGSTLRDVRAIVVLAVPFLAAPLAIGITSLLHGQISGLALGFGIVLLGIGVDFSIHLFWSLKKGAGSHQELLQALKRPIFFATLTTSTVFIVLLFSAVVSHQQMALLALSGVLLAVVFAWLLIPTIVPTENPLIRESVQTGQRHGSSKYPKIIVFFWLTVIALGVYSWPQLKYNGDLRVLDVPDEQVERDEKHFSSTWGGKKDQAFVIVQDETLSGVLDKNSIVYDELAKTRTIEFQSFAPILPGPERQVKNYQLWQKFWSQHRTEFEKEFNMVSADLGFSKKGFDPFFGWLDDKPAQLEPSEFLGGPLDPIFQSMLSEHRGESQGCGKYLAMTTVALEKLDLASLAPLEDKAGGISVLSNSKWRAEVEKQMRHDISFLSGAAGLAISLLVFLQFRQLIPTFAVLAPVLTALSAMAIYCYLSGKDLNMMHLIMGIMVIGLSVDYGIFIVCARQKGSDGSASAAVSICAASSLVGFGVLACASHPALFALGTTVLVGIGCAWPAAVFVSPAILSLRVK